MNRRRTWLWFVLPATVLVTVMAWLTVALTGLDRDEVTARRQAHLHEQLRLCLWRMDSWLSPQLAREAMRQPSDYLAFAPATTAWTRGLSRLPPDEVLVPSPLLSFRSPIFRLHFEFDASGRLTSPQAPTGNQRDVAESNGIAGTDIEDAAARLAALRTRLSWQALQQRLGGAESQLPMVGCNVVPQGAGADTAQSVQEYSNRQWNNFSQNIQQGQQNPPPPLMATATASVGPMLPIWLDGDAPLLLMVRSVQDERGVRLQGVELDWDNLSRDLLALVQDLFEPGSTALRRCDAPSPEQQGSMLASVPARLQAAPRRGHLASALPTTAILLITWGSMLLALFGLGFLLRQAISYGDRRARFASAVTHELRTPLTTFRMYSEMLADGVITDPAAQRDYLTTLRQESDRLSRVVENVLAWSRLEEGRFASRRERHGVGALLQRLLPPLQRRLDDAGMTLQLDLAADAADAVLVTDEDAVGQILFNLVDNAAKYGVGSAPAVVELQGRVSGDRVQITVRDHGPGVPPAHRTRIFAPFDRGAVPTASNDVPGVGLGLALARGLAGDLGGELRLRSDSAAGAAFELSLPRA